MANNKKEKNTVPKKKAADAVVPPRRRLIIIITAAILAAIIGGVILGIFLAKKDRGVDFWNDNLGKYINITEEQYKNYTLADIPLETVSESGLQRKINKLLVSNKKKDALYDGGYITNKPITLGDVVHIWYRGYTVDDKGVETDFEGGSNFSSTIAQLEIGSGSFIPGFEEGLIGVVPNEHPTFSTVTSGNVEAGDIIYLTCIVYYPDGSYKSLTNARIDLGDPDAVDAKYGKGFTDFFVGKTSETGTSAPQKIGETIGSKVFYIGESTMSTGYYDIKVEFATRCETNPVTIDVKFPADYAKESLRGVEAKFDVYVSYAVIYDTPEFDDKFITETLKVKDADLAGYEGATVKDRYTAYLAEEYKKEVAEQNRVVLEDGMWKYYKSVAEVKELPEKTVREFYNSYYTELENSYKSYTSYYETIDAFAIACYGLSSGADWREHILESARDIVLEKLLFYYIMREADLAPSEEYYREKYNEMYNEYLDYYIHLNSEELSKYEGEAYDAEIERLKSEMMDYYGEEYFKESVYYDYAVEKMLEYALGEGFFNN